METIHVFFSGTVQGVWFRKTTQRYAANIGITGWVKNLPDGRVEMEATGESPMLKLLIEQLKADFEITNVEQTTLPTKEVGKSFDVVY